MRPAPSVLRDPAVLRRFRSLLNSLAREATGSSHRVCRAMLLTEPPSLDAGEITDKGSINQRAVLRHRGAAVEELHAGRAVRPHHRHRRAEETAMSTPGIGARFTDAWLIDGVRTPFADYNGALAQVSPTDLGIKAARELFARTGVSPADVGTVITGNMAQASFDAFVLPRHVGLYSGVPIEVPAQMVQRVCGTGIEVICQASDAVSLGRAAARALRRHRVDEPQPDRRLYASRRLPHGPGRVQGFPLGGAARSRRQGEHGRHRGKSRPPIPDHPARRWTPTRRAASSGR